jgi:hypothetical protein
VSPGPALVAALLLAAPAPPPALEALVDQVRAQTVAAHPEAPVAVAIQAPSAMLGETASTLLASRLGDWGLAVVVIGPGEDAPARARSAGARSLIRLRLEVGAEVAAAGELRPVWRNFWAGRTPIESGPTRVLSAAVPVDRATQLLATGTAQGTGLVLDPVPLARFPVRTAALATGDLDGDGRPEVVVLAGGELWVLDAAGTLLARHSLLDLPPAAAPAREPFGTLCISEGRLLVASARAESPVALRLQGGQLVRGPGAPGPSLGCGDTAEPASFVPGVARLMLTRGTEREPLWGGDARPGHHLLLLPDGTARWFQPGAEVRLLRDIGAGAALVSWQGEVRVAASSALAAPSEDRLRLVGVGPEEPSVAVPGRILQVSPGLPGAGPALLLGVWTAEGGSELRVVRGPP